MGHLEVTFRREKNASAFMREQFGSAQMGQPTMTALADKIAAMQPANKFLRLYITYAMCSVLAPTTGVRVSPRVYPSLVNIKEAKNLNICKFVITIIRKSLKNNGENEQVMPCMLYLMVKYVDSLQLQGMDISDDGTRVSAWTNAMIKEAIKQDTKSNGSFGAAPLKAEFAEQGLHREGSIGDSHELTMSDPCSMNGGTTNVEADTESVRDQGDEQDDVHEESMSKEQSTNEERSNDFQSKAEASREQGEQSILFSDPVKIEKFIKKHAATELTADGMASYKEAIEYACHGFEASL